MYWNVIKREVKNNNYVKIVKSYECYGITDYDMKFKAKRYASNKNIMRNFFKKYYYVVEFDFE